MNAALRVHIHRCQQRYTALNQGRKGRQEQPFGVPSDLFEFQRAAQKFPSDDESRCRGCRPSRHPTTTRKITCFFIARPRKFIFWDPKSLRGCKPSIRSPFLFISASIRSRQCRPPPTHHAASGMRDRTDSDTEQDQGESSWQAHEVAEPLRSLERRRSTDEGSNRPYGIPLLSRAFDWPSPERDEPPPRFQHRYSPGTEPPLTPSAEPPGGPGSVVSHHGKRTEKSTSVEPT